MAVPAAVIRRHPLAELFVTVMAPAHRRAFALIAVLMIAVLMVAAFSVIPFMSTAFVASVGVTERQLPAVFIAGGLLTLVSTTSGPTGVTAPSR